MRFWFSGPRILGGLIRPGVSFGPEDLRPRRVTETQMERARKTVRREAIKRGNGGAT
jgi:hypothetical protein